jgi:ABC-type polysaccharide/polyol phosphate transport system ATPase subunit
MISVEAKNIDKIYKIYPSPVQRLKEILMGKPYHVPFAALSDISFSVPTGETLGIIGENGAGKSTLLKILAKTLKPTSGHVHIQGKVAALLDLGAGFNPELSGEENIYLNAFLIGLTKKDIDRRKDEIIAFSEIEDFIKRPVKTYSSGMYLRLAFSIAACVDPDILIIDEALSVGDQHFQKKCIDRMMEFKKAKKTILFCSHSLYRIQELCDRTMWLNAGKIMALGDNGQVIKAYDDFIREKDAKLKHTDKLPESVGSTEESKNVWIDNLVITDIREEKNRYFKAGDDLCLKIFIRTHDPSYTCKGHIAVAIYRNDELHLFNTTSKIEGFSPITFHDDKEISVKFKSIPLLFGQYYFVVLIGDEHALHPYDFKCSQIFHIKKEHKEFGILDIDHEWRIPE